MTNQVYHKAIELLRRCSSENGFVASDENISNYNRVWARDGVICGLAAIASGDEKLIETFKITLETLAKNQHHIGTIPSNVLVSADKIDVSYGGLAGRVDAVTWFIIGVCQYAFYKKNDTFVDAMSPAINKCLQLMDAWEFNNKHLMYIPLSGNWADEYITDGYVLYDQLLRIWALKSYNHFKKDDLISRKIDLITSQIEINFTPNSIGEKYHIKAYEEARIQEYMPCSFSPAGYKTQFDAFANSLALMLNIGDNDFQETILNYSIYLSQQMNFQMLPAFWPPIQQTDLDWNLLKNNCKYEFRNYPNEFHNGGTWAMVNGFYGMALLSKNKNIEAETLLENINHANALNDFGFYENFNSETQASNGVKYCGWSAAATIILHESIYTNFKLLI